MKIIGLTYIGGTPEILLKGDSSLLVNRKPYFIPEETLRLAAHPCLVLRISKIGKNIRSRFVRRYIDGIAAGLHIEDSGALQIARSKGKSWVSAVASDGSFPVGTFLAIEETSVLPQQIDFSLEGASLISENEDFAPKEGHKQLLVDASSIENAIVQISKHITIRQGDMIFICSHQEPFFPTEDEYVTASIEGDCNLYCKFK